MIPEQIAERTVGMDVLTRFEGSGRDGIETTMNFIKAIEVRDGLACPSPRGSRLPRRRCARSDSTEN